MLKLNSIDLLEMLIERNEGISEAIATITKNIMLSSYNKARSASLKILKLIIEKNKGITEAIAVGN